MKKIKSLIIFAVLATATFADLPLPLQPNIRRTDARDSVFGLNFQSDSPFLQAQNLRFRMRTDLVFSENNEQRVILYFNDSIGNDKLQVIFGGFFDNRAIHGKTIDWIKPGRTTYGIAYDTLPRSSFDLYRALVRFTPNEFITIGLGKDYFNWGPAELGGLMLSDYNMGFTGLYQRYQIGPFTIRGFSTQLNSSPSDGSSWRNIGNDVMPINRFLSVGRVEYYRDLWGISINQAMLYGGQTRSFEIPYLIPFFPFHYAQIANWRYGNNGDNSFGGLDAYVNLFDKKLQIYGELLVDDFQQGETEDSRNIQNLTGFTAGARFDIPNIIYGFVEAGQINSFVFNHVGGYSMKYLNKDAFIGSPLGPDNQLYWGQIGRLWDRIGLRTEFFFWLLRQGERDINLDYDFAYLIGTRHDNIPFGDVRRETAAWISATYEFKQNSISAFAGIQNTRIEGISETSNTTPFFGLTLNAAIGFGWR